MRKLVIGVLLGVVLTVGVCVPVFFKERRDKFEFGVKNGVIAGRFDAAGSLEKEFGRYDGKTPYKLLFSVKTTDVVCIETNGVKTVRIIP